MNGRTKMVSPADNTKMRKRQDRQRRALHHNEFDFDSFSGHQLPVHYHEDDEGAGGGEEEKHLQSDLRGDRGNIAILFFLYLLQGIPLGLTAAIPMLLQNRGASYKQQVRGSNNFPFKTNRFSLVAGRIQFRTLAL